MTDEDFISVDYVLSLLPGSFWIESPVYAETGVPEVLHLEAAPTTGYPGYCWKDFGPCVGHWFETDLQEREGPNHGIRDSER